MLQDDNPNGPRHESDLPPLEPQNQGIWASFMLLGPFPRAVIATIVILGSFFAFLVVADSFRTPERQKEALVYCEPDPTPECRKRVLAVDELCDQQAKNTVSRNKSLVPVYKLCMDKYLRGWSDKVGWTPGDTGPFTIEIDPLAD